MRTIYIVLLVLMAYSVKAPAYANATSGKQDQHVTSGERSAALSLSKSRTIDSCKAVIKEAQHDTSVCDAYSDWGVEVYLSNLDTALILWQKGLDLAEKNLASNQDEISRKKYLSCTADALNNIGYIYHFHGNVEKGLEYYIRSLEILKELDSKKELADVLNNIGGMYDDLGDISRALEYYHKSLELDQTYGNREGVATSLNNIGLVYEHQGSIERALEFFHKGLKIYEEINDREGVAVSFNNLGVIYQGQGDFIKGLEFHQKSIEIREEMNDKHGVAHSLNNMGAIYRKQGDMGKGLDYYRQSLQIFEELGDKEGGTTLLDNIGNIYMEQDSLTEALKYFQKSLAIKEEINDKKGLAYSLKNIGEIYYRRGNLNDAKTYALNSLSSARDLGFPATIASAARLLVQIHRKEGEFEEAMKMFELFIQMKDSINNERTQKATIRQQTKYEFEKAQLVKEQQEKEEARILSEETSRRDNLQYSVIFIAILVLFSGVLALGFINVSERMAEGIIFFSFLILFEFLLVLADPYIDLWSGGAPGIKLLFNAGIAALIFPAHAFFEGRLKKRLVKRER